MLVLRLAHQARAQIRQIGPNPSNQQRLIA
jgi:hypothetical protein